MSVNQGYSSGEEDATVSSTSDIFGLKNLTAPKKARVEELQPSIIPDAAPDVLAEVIGRFFESFYHLLNMDPGPIESNFFGHPPN